MQNIISIVLIYACHVSIINDILFILILFSDYPNSRSNGKQISEVKKIILKTVLDMTCLIRIRLL